MKFNKNATLGEVKAHLKEKWLKGETCPACNQFVKLYKIKISGQAVRDLLKLCVLTDGNTSEYRHINEFSNLASRSFSKLAHWGLVTDQVNDDAAKRTSGMWAITEKGVQFARKQIEVSRYAYLYNSECKALSPDTVGVREALGNKFNYEELMNNY